MRAIISVEVYLLPCCHGSDNEEQVKNTVHTLLHESSMYHDMHLYDTLRITTFPLNDDGDFLRKHVSTIMLTDIDSAIKRTGSPLTIGQSVLNVYLFHMNDEVDDIDDDNTTDGDGNETNVLSALSITVMPNISVDMAWENLVYDDDVKGRLLAYCSSAMLLSDLGVSENQVTWNRIILLCGEPGTGKSSLCRALAQKLAIRMRNRYSYGLLVEVNTHSLLSKWFSESGKLIRKAFARIETLAENSDTIVTVLLDEVESLTGNRTNSADGMEPLESIRAVNAILNAVDKLAKYRNVLFLCTTNITRAIDSAFIDRADLKIRIGPPSTLAAYIILRAGISELMRVGIIAPREQLLPAPTLASMRFRDNSVTHNSMTLWKLSEQCCGHSGRSLKKLPFIAHMDIMEVLLEEEDATIATVYETDKKVSLSVYMRALAIAVKREQHEKDNIMNQ